MAGRVLNVECCAPATATAMATASATAATTDTASNRHPSRRQDQPPAKKNCVANWLQWLLLPVLLLATAPYCSLLLLDGSCFDSDSSPVSLTRSPPPPTASYRRLLPHVLQLQLLPITGATNRSSPLLLRLLLRLRLLKRHPSRQQDHPRRQMAATGRNGSTTFRLLLSVATAAAAATATATASASASAPDSPTRSPASTITPPPTTASPYCCYGCLFLSKQYQR